MFSVTCSLPPANEVWSKVIISQVSVRPQGGGGRDRPPWTETPRQNPPGQRPPLDRPLDRDPLLTETPLWTETPLDRDPLDPWTETSLNRPPGQTPSGQRPTLDRDPSGQRPPLDRDPPGQRPPCTVKSVRYTSYWNAFLFLNFFT